MRTKQWWANLTKEERSALIYLERNANHGGSMGGYLPDDCSECCACGNPKFGSIGGLCNFCQTQLDWIIAKADRLNKPEIVKAMPSKKIIG